MLLHRVRLGDTCRALAAIDDVLSVRATRARERNGVSADRARRATLLSHPIDRTAGRLLVPSDAGAWETCEGAR
jgi:hypothetical protein